MYINKNSSFEWDERKNIINEKKHSISFFEAMTVFDDDNALFEYDSEGSQDEDRFINIGMSANTQLLVVCHCYRESDYIIRIISARTANSLEREKYGGQFQ